MHRYLPDRALPRYTFVPGHNPRQEGDASARDPEEALDPAAWQRCEAYLFGIDLFHHGYYWEAHEAWEGLWHAAGRSGAVGALLKGLIRLAAAGVKVRQGLPGSVRRHGAAAERNFLLAQELGGAMQLCGMDLVALAAFGRHVAEQAERWRGDPTLPVQVVFDRPLVV